MKLNDLQDVLTHELRDLYHAEKQLVAALPRMAKGAHAPELQDAIQEHLEITKGQVERLETIFDELDMAARGITCHGMKGLVEEGKEILDVSEESDPDAVDAAIIGAAQKVEHYEISAYGTCRSHAETLGLSRIAELLQETLDEEVEADEKLSQIAMSLNSAAKNGKMMDGEDNE